LLTGLLRGKSLEHAGRLAAAAGACCVTARGATAGLRDYAETARLAGLAAD
jgi:sugar/nucleoside kinase (ribokinase family)